MALGSRNVKIDLVFNPLVEARNLRQKIRSVNHAFILLTDDCKVGHPRRFYRGRPTNEFGTIKALNDGFGLLTTYEGPYFKGGVDWKKPEDQIFHNVLYKKKEPVENYKTKLSNSITRTKQARITYEALGPNSNSVVYQALRDIGINIPGSSLPRGVDAPGWGMNLRSLEYHRRGVDSKSGFPR